MGRKIKRTCDWCGYRGTEVFITHYGTGNGYNRLMCPKCKEEIEANGGTVLTLEEEEKLNSEKNN